MMKNSILFIRICYYIGAVVDLMATIPLMFPDIAKLMFGLNDFSANNDYLYASRIGASLMLGWTFLLLWGSFKPIERKGVLLLTVLPVLGGLLISSILAVTSGFIEFKFMLPLWIFYALIIPLYIVTYVFAYKIKSDQ
jgi:hypothetical protein